MRYKNVCCSPLINPLPHRALPLPTAAAMPKFMHFRTVKMSKEGEREHIFCFWGNNYLNKAPKKIEGENGKKLRGTQTATKRLSYVQNKSRMLTKCWPNMHVGMCVCVCEVYVAYSLPHLPLFASFLYLAKSF